jgi:glucose/mannose-6-phosphate isomerase
LTLDVLDDPAAIDRLDPQGLIQRIEALPEQCHDGMRRATALSVPSGAENAAQIVVLGMGGSAIAGDILASLAEAQGRKAVSVVRGYHAPAYVGEETLVVACSHSGNTEETLSALEQTLAAGAMHVAVTTGGRLVELAKTNNVPAYLYEYDGEPRSAIGHQLTALLAIAEQAGVIHGAEAAVDEATRVMRARRQQTAPDVPAAKNPGKQLAGRLRNKLPVVIGAGVLGQAAHRWKTQLNENADIWALWDELPEMDHNTVVGLARPENVVSDLHAVFLDNPSLHPRVRLRYGITEEELVTAGVSSERIAIDGVHPLAQVLDAIYLGDVVSYYLALLQGVQPSPVKPIDRVKAKLSG